MSAQGFAFAGGQDGQRVLSQQVRTLLLATIVAAASSLLPLETVHVPLASYVPVHTILECLSILTALLVFATVWFTPSRESSASMVVISVALLAAAGLDFMHMMSIRGMPDFVTPSSTQKSITFWLAARGSATVGFLVGSCIPKTVSLTKATRRGLTLAFVLYATGVTAVLFFHESSVPAFFVAGSGTTLLKTLAETVLLLLLALAAWRYHRLARAGGESYDALMFGAMAVAAVGEWFFTNYAVGNDTQNLLGHAYKIFSYWLIFQAMFILSVRKPYEWLAVQKAKLLQANEALRVQSLALESTATPVLVTDVHGMVTWRNRASVALKQTLSTGEACLFDRALTPNPEQALQMRARLAAGEVWRGLVKIKSEQGQDLYLDRTVTPVRSETGTLEGYVSVSENMTSNVQAQARHKRVLETALDGYWVIDNLGRFLEVNEAYVRMSGYSTAELLAMRVQDLKMDQDKSEVQERLLKARQAGYGRFESRHRTRDGRALSVDVSLTYDAELDNFYVFVRDLTEQERSTLAQQDLERQLQHAQKMQALGQLTGGIAHDFNNILSSILGYSNLAITRFAQDRESKLAKYLHEIVAASERARDLIAKMLTYSRTQPAGPVGVISPSAVVREVVAMLRPSIPSSIQLKYSLESDLPISMDAGELNQVLVNLVINARDAIAGQGLIELRVRPVHLDGRICAISHQRLSGGYLAVEVSDSGAGIAPENLGSLFNPFFTTKDVGKGTGLGLSVVQGILRKCGGHVMVDSRPGCGSLFQLLFPVAQSVKLPQLKASPPLSQDLGAGQTIWVVDDERAVAGFVGELLSDSGYRVRVFHDPLLALSTYKADHQGVDLLITDQTMPGLTGLQLVGLMHDIRGNLPIIICTGFSDGIPAQELAQHAIQKLFIKPVPSAGLLQAVAEILAGKTTSASHHATHLDERVA